MTWLPGQRRSCSSATAGFSADWTGPFHPLQQLTHQQGDGIAAGSTLAWVEIAGINCHPAAVAGQPQLEVEVGAGAEAGATNPANYLALAHPVALLDVKLAEVAIKGAAPRPIVFNLNRQAVATRQSTANHHAAKG